MLTDKQKTEAKLRFKTALKDFAKELQAYVSTDDGQWSIKGFIDAFKNIYTITADTKIVSKVLEIHLFPKILEFAERQKLRVVLAEKQNWYPDFSFVRGEKEELKFAVDLKTTYRDPKFPGHVNGFTLGSHGKYFMDRQSKKNIQFPYSEYLGHFCLGTIYTRTVSDDLTGMDTYSVDELHSGEEKMSKRKEPIEVDIKGEQGATSKKIVTPGPKRVAKLESIVSVVKDFQFFACEKWELASDHQGSKNTANIGGITWIEHILSGNGMFSKLGEAGFDEYWMNYGRIQLFRDGKPVMNKKGEASKITRLEDYMLHKRMKMSLYNPKRLRKRAIVAQKKMVGPTRKLEKRTTMVARIPNESPRSPN